MKNKISNFSIHDPLSSSLTLSQSPSVEIPEASILPPSQLFFVFSLNSSLVFLSVFSLNSPYVILLIRRTPSTLTTGLMVPQLRWRPYTILLTVHSFPSGLSSSSHSVVHSKLPNYLKSWGFNCAQIVWNTIISIAPHYVVRWKLPKFMGSDLYMPYDWGQTCVDPIA